MDVAIRAVLVFGWNSLFADLKVMWISCTIFSLYLPSDRPLPPFPSTLNDPHFWSYRVISKVVPAPEAKPATPVSRPKTPPPVPSPVPAPVHVTPPPAPVPAPPQPTVSPALLPPASPAVSAAGGSKAPVRSVVTETVSTYVVGDMCCDVLSHWHSSPELLSFMVTHHFKLMALDLRCYSLLWPLLGRVNN